MDRLKSLAMYYGYNTLVVRDGRIQKLDLADIIHAEDNYWSVKLILYPIQDSFKCPETIKEASNYFESLKFSHVDFLGLIEEGFAVSVNSLSEDPYIK